MSACHHTDCVQPPVLMDALPLLRRVLPPPAVAAGLDAQEGGISYEEAEQTWQQLLLLAGQPDGPRFDQVLLAGSSGSDGVQQQLAQLQQALQQRIGLGQEQVQQLVGVGSSSGSVRPEELQGLQDVFGAPPTLEQLLQQRWAQVGWLARVMLHGCLLWWQLGGVVEHARCCLCLMLVQQLTVPIFATHRSVSRASANTIMPCALAFQPVRAFLHPTTAQHTSYKCCSSAFSWAAPSPCHTELCWGVSICPAGGSAGAGAGPEP